MLRHFFKSKNQVLKTKYRTVTVLSYFTRPNAKEKIAKKWLIKKIAKKKIARKKMREVPSQL